MKDEDKTKLVRVFKGSLWEAELVKGLLASAGIESTIKDALLINLPLPESAIDVAVLVNECDYVAATEVIDKQKENGNSDTE